MSLVLGPWSPPGAIAREGGGKANGLLRLEAAGQRVPAWCVVSAKVLDDVLVRTPLARIDASAGQRDAADADGYARAVAEALSSAPLPPALESELAGALSQLRIERDWLAVRSSGLEEDAAEHSFAGQFDSFLFRRGTADVLAAIRLCWASAWSARNRDYRARAGLDGRPPRMGVIVQRMIDADAGGVAFSRDPARPLERDAVIVESVFGLTDGLVSGELPADHFEIDRGTLEVRERRVATKTHARRPASGGGTELRELEPGRASVPSLDDRQIRAVATAAIALEEALGTAQDCEFAWANGELHLLQTRPITSLPPAATFDPGVTGDDVVIWDNSNIIESFAGVTTALTFTHASRAYREVYLQVARVLGVPVHVLAQNEPVFRNMLGFIRGRIYYNLVNWYRTLGLVPGLGSSSSMMESMMGVRQSLTPELASLLDLEPPRYSLFRRALVPTRAALRMIRIDASIREFMVRIERVYGPLERSDLRALGLTEQLALYRRLEDEVLRHWTAPIVNDTRCMLAFGILRALTDRWVAPAVADAESLQNDLLCGEGDLKSTEPTKLLMRIAERLAAGDAALRDRFLALEPADALPELRATAPEIGALFDDFLRRYGFRCVNEQKLEEPDLHDDPSFLIASVQGYLRHGGHTIAAMESREGEIRAAAEGRARAALRGLRRRVYFAAVRWARRAVSDRELLRFERTRTFGVTRRLFRGMGANLVRLDALDDEHDVFHLTLDELVAYVEGRAAGTDLRPIVAARKAEYAEHARTPAPPDRFLTRGAVGTAARHPAVLAGADLLASEATDADPSVLRGTACSPGIVEAAVRVAHRLEDATGIEGEILVTERTDPGWVPVFPACAGIIIERGSVLSHSAVVARELGIPTIVNVAGRPTERLRSGQRVRMDGARGEIRILD
ncbi:MAG TPA: PEP/pyruvate-binding domain-containing protein [Longimicrobiales bacterium]|nr:PEP/pyruvate-binding domain-containing protein [Longimicrobiales bacterium]